MSRIQDDRRRVEQAEIRIETRDRSFNDARGPAMTAVGPVRSDRDRVKVLSQTTTVRPEPVEGLPFLPTP